MAGNPVSKYKFCMGAYYKLSKSQCCIPWSVFRERHHPTKHGIADKVHKNPWWKNQEIDIGFWFYPLSSLCQGVFQVFGCLCGWFNLKIGVGFGGQISKRKGKGRLLYLGLSSKCMRTRRMMYQLVLWRGVTNFVRAKGGYMSIVWQDSCRQLESRWILTCSRWAAVPVKPNCQSTHGIFLYPASLAHWKWQEGQGHDIANAL